MVAQGPSFSRICLTSSNALRKVFGRCTRRRSCRERIRQVLHFGFTNCIFQHHGVRFANSLTACVSCSKSLPSINEAVVVYNLLFLCLHPRVDSRITVRVRCNFDKYASRASSQERRAREHFTFIHPSPKVARIEKMEVLRIFRQDLLCFPKIRTTFLRDSWHSGHSLQFMVQQFWAICVLRLAHIKNRAPLWKASNVPFLRKDYESQSDAS